MRCFVGAGFKPALLHFRQAPSGRFETGPYAAAAVPP